ncbi:MAG: hypothetical protein QOJ56_1866 [Mycobacterium sp.]|jgi:hypothetical protein|nr:hypothetical protein [Mycobacterium sp.]
MHCRFRRVGLIGAVEASATEDTPELFICETPLAPLGVDPKTGSTRPSVVGGL